MIKHTNPDIPIIRPPDHTFSVLIAEDEELAMAHLLKLIETVGIGFSVVAKAHNGQEALEYLSHTTVDLVVTDIYMPVMDGLTLLETIRKKYPSVQVLVVSGYQEFSLVKTAFTKGTLDYILKPLSPTKIRTTFSLLWNQIEQTHRTFKQALLKDLCNQTKVDQSTLHHMFPEHRYLIAIYCEGGIPTNYYQSNQFESVTIENRMSIFSGRKRTEWYALYPYHNADSFVCFKHQMHSFSRKETPHMLVFLSTPFMLTDFTNILTSLHNYLNSHLVLGRIDEKCWDGKKVCCSPPLLSNHDAQMIALLLTESRFEDFKSLVASWIELWEKDQRPQAWIRGMLQQVLRLLLKLAQSVESNSNYEIDFDDCFYELQNFTEMKDRIIDLFDVVINTQYATFHKIDTPQFFSQVQDYLQEHSNMVFTLQNLCDTFGISQTYMSRLFRKYSQKSYNELLTEIRIKKAILLLIKQPLLQIKDIAELVGYKDQFYFSRIFHREVGMTASEYRKIYSDTPMS